ncbi:DUF4355 domain-containing protein [Clostridium algidicarnis]|uniref:capsid assembly scaffolding protein Gp46 family protein n=1 Tax=Clostridium algidicarnis TaxID=37659 RepID=UPI001C0CCFE3|nr:DUF4355 domain-containing protein [Clostridium algidicarnis]MBU3208043.1 DUF4355 domain-containing protein [Clostridium algidicarnis]
MDKEVDGQEVEVQEPEIKAPIGDSEINQIIKTQMAEIQEKLQADFMEKFNLEFSGKIDNFENEKKEFQSVKQKHAIKELLLENNLESNFLDFVYDDDIEVSKLKLAELNTIIDNRVQNAVNERFKQYSYIPPSSGETFIPDNGYVKPPYIL